MLNVRLDQHKHLHGQTPSQVVDFDRSFLATGSRA